MSDKAVETNDNKPNVMEKIATFIVDKRKAFLVIFAVLIVYAVTSMSKVQVNNSLTDYLSEETETRQGVDIMDKEFVTFGSATILVANITYDRALSIAETLEEIDGISGVSFYDATDEEYDDKELEDYYKDSAALFTLTFDETEETELSQKAIAEAREYLADYDTSVYTTVDKDDAADLQEDMKVILVIAVCIIVGVLLFTSKTYMEIVIFLITFGVAAIINMGTNYWFGEISFITNAVSPVLQLALAIDYAIILFHRFMEEKEQFETRRALILALSKAIPEIASSSLTTVSGMVALMFMQFGIGPDLGQALVKAILISLLTVFCFMPALIYMFDKQIAKTAHRSFVPKIRLWGKFIVKTRYILLPVFLVALGVGFYYSMKCPYIYDPNSVQSQKMNEFLTAKKRIEQTFDVTNTMALVVPEGDYRKEAKVISLIGEIEEVDTVLGLANIEVGENDEYTLVDSLRPREFAEVADVDVELVKTLYRIYAIDQEQYGALLSNVDDYEIPIVNMVDFIYDQKENRGLKLGDELSEEIDDIYNSLNDAREQLEGEEYNRIVFTLKGPVEGEGTFKIIDRVRTLAQTYYEDDVYVVGDPTSAYDLSKSFVQDNNLISVLTVLFVGIILLFTFQSAGIPFMLVLTIQGSIWINFALPYLTDSSMFFLSYLVVSSIQMGATIDYAIVITSRYMDLRTSMPSKKEAIVESLDQAFPTIVTSGTILCAAGFVIGQVSSNATVASIGTTLGTGTLISIILVMTVLPQILLLGDIIIEKSAFTISSSLEAPGQLLSQSGAMRMEGHVKGYFAGTIDAKISGSLDGDMQLMIERKKEEETDDEQTLA